MKHHLDRISCLAVSMLRYSPVAIIIAVFGAPLAFLIAGACSPQQVEQAKSAADTAGKVAEVTKTAAEVTRSLCEIIEAVSEVSPEAAPRLEQVRYACYKNEDLVALTELLSTCTINMLPAVAEMSQTESPLPESTAPTAPVVSAPSASPPPTAPATATKLKP